MNKILQLPRGAKPLTVLRSGELAFSLGERVCVLEDCGRWSARASLEQFSIKGLIGRNCLAARALRWEARCAVEIKDGLLISWRGALFRCDLGAGSVSCVFCARRGFSTPLTIQPADGELQAIWGDYGQNPENKPVGVYGLTKEGRVLTLYEFPAGQIRHIHGFAQRIAGGWYIFTGDMEDAAGIYVADGSFSSVEPLAIGEQRFRAVRGYDTRSGLVYATDSSLVDNYVYLLPDENPSNLRVLSSLNGPCIYGTTCEAGYLFSTTVEPDERLKGLLSYLSTKPGPGVHSCETQLLLVSNDAKVKEVLRIDKDAFPMKLMQYGSVQFASGQENSGRVVGFCRSLRGFDAMPIEMEVM